MSDLARPLVSVQMVNFRTRNYVKRALPAVVADLAASAFDYEINILENGSGETLDDIAAQFDCLTVSVSATNLGFGGGHNLLAAKSKARYLLLLNPDIGFLTRGTAERLVATLLSDKRAKAVGPRLVTPEGKPQRYDHGRLYGLRAQISYRAGQSYWRPTKAKCSVAWVSGAVMLVERRAFTAIGGFDERYFMYKEDEDLCLRLRQRGAKVIYDPGVTVRHDGSVVAPRGEQLEQATRAFVDAHFSDGPWRRTLERVHRALPYLRL